MTNSDSQRWTDDRLDALAASTQSLLDATQANTATIGQVLEQQKVTDKKIELLIEGQLAMQTLHGQLAEQTSQLKRAVDYLLSKDGGQF
ncbi:hypothetical protein [Acaryochloris marina]|uniref:Uncharacterized protein n=1 Tax=Acaryochloris marina (strain MBIC 11017) TaxID=329726 RepID=A8ZQM7_ACAM1|nr:hypothetical protein [Acaryochloris marina]ABW33313.1 hypothetical protein AM1_G0133 [Acaryochloris marina MBIC11017]